jgi:hypothetical protein
MLTTIRSALPSRESTDYNQTGLTLSPEGQARVLKESRAYRDAVTLHVLAVEDNKLGKCVMVIKSA